MAKLVLTIGGKTIREILLRKERITIGRHLGNDIVIDGHAISAKHAVIMQSDDDWCLMDLNSTNGTQINGQPIGTHFLRDGDVIELSPYQIRFIDATGSQEPNGFDGERNAVVPTVQKNAQSEPPHEIDSRTFSKGSVGVITVTTGPNAGKSIILNKPLTTIGIPGRQVAAITAEENGYKITHVEGDTRLSVNGKALAGPIQLQDGDQIALTAMHLSFGLRGRDFANE